jgi:VWFA-related protein
VGGLTRDDFQIEDGGKKRELTAFSVETTQVRATAPASSGGGDHAAPAAVTATATAAAGAPPRFLALVFDDVSMGPGDLIPTRKAAKSFLAQSLTAGDVASIFFISRGQVLPFTADAVKLDEALDKLSVAQGGAHLPVCPILSAYEAYLIANRTDATLLPAKAGEAVRCGLCPVPGTVCSSRVEGLAISTWNQVRFASSNNLSTIRTIVDYLAKLPGKRVLVMASSGFVSETLEAEREDIINRALHGNVVINTLDAKGLSTMGGDASEARSGRSVLARARQGNRPAAGEAAAILDVLAASTGGQFVHDKNDLETGFRDLGLAPEVSYSMAFTPPAPDGKYHSLKVRLKESRHYTVQARQGYFASVAPPAKPAAERKIDKEVMGNTTREEVPVRISSLPGTTTSGVPSVRLVLHLDVPHMPFVIKGGVRRRKLTMVAALFDSNGNFVTGRQCEMDLHLKENTFKELSDGMDAAVTLNAPAGKYRLRGVVEDAEDGKITASSLPVEIP